MSVYAWAVVVAALVVVLVTVYEWGKLVGAEDERRLWEADLEREARARDAERFEAFNLPRLRRVK